jgi:peptidyl-prolyl cis-trans isomerase D
MLSQMRQNTKTVLWIVIVAFVGLIVVGWGMQQRTGGSGPEAGVVGSVAGTRITTQEYRSELENQRQSYYQQYGRPKTVEDEQQIVDASWESIIRRHVLYGKIEDWNIVTTDDEVLREIQYNPPPFIRQHPAFQTDSLFDHQKYMQALRDPRVDFSFLENYIRETLPYVKLEEYLAGCVRVTDEELISLVKMFQETAKLSYVRVNPYSDFQDLEVTPTEDDLRAHYEANREDFRIPEKRVFKYVDVIKEPGIQDKRFARERIEEAYDLISAGSDDFDEIAVLYSDDQQSAEKGGEMGWIAKGRLPQPADSIVFSLEIGDLSDIIEMHRAYHFFMVTDRRETEGVPEVMLHQVMTLAEVSPATIEMLGSNAEDLAEAARERGLDEAAAELEYAVDSADQITLDGAARRFGVETEVAEAVFAAPAGEILDPIEGRGAFFVIEVMEVMHSSIPAFEDAREVVERAYVLSVKTDAAREKAEAVAAQVEGGATLEAAASAHGLRVRTTEAFTRMSNVPGIGGINEITANAFALAEGETAGPLESTGSFFVIRVDSKVPYDRQQFAQELMNLKMSAVMSKQQGFIGDWYEAAKTEVEIEDYRGAEF